jgi:hypothetical protein
MSYLEKFEEKISFFSNHIFFSLLIVGIIGFSIRILFLNIEIPMNSDNLLYFRVGIDQITGYSSDTDLLSNDGWPMFLSLFFSIFPSNNFIDFMALQKFLSIGISVLTIIPVYFLVKHFFSKQYAVLGSAIFVFEPRIIQNSLFGITEPLNIIAMTISLVLILNKKYYIQYISFATISFATLVRAEGLFLFPVFIIIFLIRSGISKKTFLHLLIIALIITSILLPASIIRSEKIGHDGVSSRITGGIEHISKASDENQFQIFSIIMDGIINMLKFLAWSQIPYLIFFVPIGFFLLIKNGNKYEKSLILVGISALIPTIYAYSFASDSRWIFPIYPIFCIMSIYSLKYFLQKTNKPKSITVLIFLLIITSSVFYVNLKDIDDTHELELYNLSLEISKRAVMVNAFSPESSYLHVVGLTKIDEFPISSNKYLEKNIDIYWYNEFSSLKDIINEGRDLGLTHLVIDENERRPQFVKNILLNEGEFPYLIKEFDSLEHDYKYNLKLYKINYEKFEETR